MDDLETLFAQADEVGNKYLTESEIESIKQQILDIRKDIWINCLTDEDLDEM